MSAGRCKCSVGRNGEGSTASNNDVVKDETLGNGTRETRQSTRTRQDIAKNALHDEINDSGSVTLIVERSKVEDKVDVVGDFFMGIVIINKLVLFIYETICKYMRSLGTYPTVASLLSTLSRLFDPSTFPKCLSALCCLQL